MGGKKNGAMETTSRTRWGKAAGIREGWKCIHNVGEGLISVLDASPQCPAGEGDDGFAVVFEYLDLLFW